MSSSPRRAVALLIGALGVLSAPAPANDDRLKTLQTANAATATLKLARPYHFGSQGTPGVFSNHTSHSNRLIPFYTFGRKIDPSNYLGPNSPYRHAEKIQALYGFVPKNTLNPRADYCDQSDAARIMADAVKRGVKHLFIVWFDGLDWPSTQAAAVARSGKIYTEGKGSGLIFQDYTAEGSAHFGYYVTAPTADENVPDVTAQTVTIPSTTLRGGYDAEIAGATPWALGPLGPKAPGYLKGQSGHEADKSGVAAIGRELHAYTDSAPSAAEFVSGKKAYNNSINVMDDGTPTPTLLHTLQNAGWKVGTVTSVPFNHASPSAMYAHNVDRDDYQDLARDMLGLRSITQQAGKEPAHPGLDVVMGTGFGQVASAKGLLAQGHNGTQGNLYITDADKAAIDVAHGGNYVVAQTTPGTSGAKVLADAAQRARSSNHRLFALFGTSTLTHLPYRTADGRFDPAPDLDGKAESYTKADLTEQPTLADMTRAALTVVARSPDQPFALFIEAGDVDFALHKNNLDNAVGAVYSGEDAIKAVISWVETQSNWDDSAMVVAADHGHYLVIDDLKAIAGVK